MGTPDDMTTLDKEALGDVDPERYRERLEGWLGERLGTRDVELGPLSSPGESGFSSETMILDVTWTDGDTRASDRLVTRGRPAGHPVFPDYDLAMQAAVIRAAGAAGVPVPEVMWWEPDESVIGTPFYVMRHVEGVVPTDNPPYTTTGFLFDATPDEQRHAYESVLAALSAVHGVDIETVRGHVDRPEFGPAGLGQQIARWERFFEWASQDRPQPTCDAAFEILRSSRPETHARDVLCWGDARLGNVIMRDFEVVGVLDWEMAHIGPRESDVAWCLYFNRFFSDALGVPDLPGFPGTDEGVALYEELSGAELRDMDWWTAWSCLRFCGTIIRVCQRMALAGVEIPGFTETDNFATRHLAELLDLPAPE